MSFEQLQLAILIVALSFWHSTCVMMVQVDRAVENPDVWSHVVGVVSGLTAGTALLVIAEASVAGWLARLQSRPGLLLTLIVLVCVRHFPGPAMLLPPA